MHALRCVFLLICVGCVAVVALNGRWEGHLTRGNHTWIVNLRRAPVWMPPPNPPYSKFWEDFKRSEDFPAEGTSGLTIRRVLKLDWMAVDLLLYLWFVNVVCAVLYVSMRGGRRDLILHLGLSTGISLTAAAAACIGLWLLFGGWGPPAPAFFGGMGVVTGVFVGLVSYKRGRTKPAAAPDRGNS